MSIQSSRLILSVLLVVGCSGGTSPLSPGDKGDDGAGGGDSGIGDEETSVTLSDCELQCTNGKFDPVPLNLVVLTSDSRAPPLDTGPEDSGCAPSDTGWPCLHINSLAKEFVNVAGNPVCGDTADPESCVRFKLGAHAYRADLDASSASILCTDALDLGDGPIDTAGESAWADQVAAAAVACPVRSLYNPRMLNVYLVDNTFSNTSFATFNANNSPDCYGMNLIDVARLPKFGPGSGLHWVNGAGEHEMGHAFNLFHTCKSNFPNSTSDTSNIMQTTAKNCCQEAQGIDFDTGDTKFPDTGSYWAQYIAADCSTDDAPPIGCDATSPTWNDPDCFNNPGFSIGDRDGGFSNSVNGSDSDGTYGQVETILNAAGLYCQCVCNEDHVDERKATAVTGELPCHPGSGEVAFFPFAVHDRDRDGSAMVELVPVVVSGDHLGRLSWITSFEVVDWGDASRLVGAKDGHGWAFVAGDPDSLDTNDLEVFDTGRTSDTLESGVIRTGYLWATDGISVPVEEWEWPRAEMEWGCYYDYNAEDVKWTTRPSNAYILKIEDIVGDWKQQVLIRPDLTGMYAWMELRGNPRAADRILLSTGANGTYTWTYSQVGMEVHGWLKPVGSPVGSKLRVHIDEISYGEWSVTNLTLDDLDKLP